MPSVGAVAGRKPRDVDRLRKASRRARSAFDMSPHHAGDAYDSLATYDCGLKNSMYSVCEQAMTPKSAQCKQWLRTRYKYRWLTWTVGPRPVISACCPVITVQLYSYSLDILLYNREYFYRWTSCSRFQTQVQTNCQFVDADCEFVWRRSARNA